MNLRITSQNVFTVLLAAVIGCAFYNMLPLSVELVFHYCKHVLVWNQLPTSLRIPHPNYSSLFLFDMPV